jgi:hypothetical protein
MNSSASSIKGTSASSTGMVDMRERENNGREVLKEIVGWARWGWTGPGENSVDRMAAGRGDWTCSGHFPGLLLSVGHTTSLQLPNCHQRLAPPKPAFVMLKHLRTGR